MEFSDASVVAVSRAYHTTLGAVCAAIESVCRSALPADAAALDQWLSSEAPLHPFSELLPGLSPYHAVVILLMYVACMPGVFVAGRVIGRRSYDVIGFFYNAAMTVLSAYVCLETLRNATAPFQHDDPAGWPMAKAVWLFYALSVASLPLTHLHLLRHNYKLITWFHIYHRAAAVVVTCSVARLAPGGDASLPVLAASATQAVAYAYNVAMAVVPGHRALRTKASVLSGTMGVQCVMTLLCVYRSEQIPPLLGALLTWHAVSVLLGLVSGWIFSLFFRSGGGGGRRNVKPSRAAVEPKKTR